MKALTARVEAYSDLTIISALLISAAVAVLVVIPFQSVQSDDTKMGYTSEVLMSIVLASNVFGTAVILLQKHHAVRLLSATTYERAMEGWLSGRTLRNFSVIAISASLPTTLLAIIFFALAGTDVDSGNKTSAAVLGAGAIATAAAVMYVHFLQYPPLDNNRNTEIHDAASRGDYFVIKTLLLEDVNVDANEPGTDRIALHCAAEGGHETIVDLLYSDARRTQVTSNGETPLIKAVVNSHSKLIQKLAAAGTVNLRPTGGEFSGYTPLHVAASQGYLSCAMKLLAANANPDSLLNPSDETPLHLALEKKHLNVAKVVAPAHLIDTARSDGKTPLHLAVLTNNRDAEDWLLTQGARADIQDQNGNTSVLLAVDAGRDDVDKLVQRADNVNDSRNSDSATALHLAVKLGLFNAVTSLLARNAQADLPNARTETALMVTIELKQPLYFRKQLIQSTNGGLDIQRMDDGWTALHVAVANKDVISERLLLDKGASTNLFDTAGITPLMLAIEQGRGDINRLVDAPSIDQRRQTDGATALHIAVAQGNRAAESVLLLAGAKSDVENTQQVTPLLLAVEQGRLDLRHLLDNATTVEATNVSGKTALLIALETSNSEAIDLLVDKGANGGAPDNTGLTSLMICARNGHSGYLKRLLQSASPGAIDFQHYDTKRTALHLAAPSSYGCMDALIWANANLDVLDSIGKTPLHTFVETRLHGGIDCTPKCSGREQLLTSRLKTIINLFARDDKGMTPLHRAASVCRADIVKELLQNLNAASAQKLMTIQDNKGALPLHCAIVNLEKRATNGLFLSCRDSNLLLRFLIGSYQEIANQKFNDVPPLLMVVQKSLTDSFGYVDQLLSLGSDVGAVDQDQNTALHFASARGFERTVEVLIRRKCPADHPNVDGQTALHWASRSGHFNVVRRLLSRAVVNATDSESRTPLMFAAQSGHPAVLQLLLLNGANLNCTDERDNTALDLAVSTTILAEKPIDYRICSNLENLIGYYPHDLNEMGPFEVCVELLMRAKASVRARTFLLAVENATEGISIRFLKELASSAEASEITKLKNASGENVLEIAKERSLSKLSQALMKYLPGTDPGNNGGRAVQADFPVYEANPDNYRELAEDFVLTESESGDDAAS